MVENLVLEALHYNIDVLCPLSNGHCHGFQNCKFVNNGTKVAKCSDTVNSAIESTCNIAFGGAHSKGVFLTGGDNFLVLGWDVGEDRFARLSAVCGSVGRAMNDKRSH